MFLLTFSVPFTGRINIVLPFASCERFSQHKAQHVLFLCPYVVVSGYSNTAFVPPEVLKIPCILSAHVVQKKGQSEEFCVMKVSYLIQKASNDQVLKKRPQRWLYIMNTYRMEKSSGFCTLSIFHVQKYFYDITFDVYSGCPVLCIPNGVETTLRILLKEGSQII